MIQKTIAKTVTPLPTIIKIGLGWTRDEETGEISLTSANASFRSTEYDENGVQETGKRFDVDKSKMSEEDFEALYGLLAKYFEAEYPQS